MFNKVIIYKDNLINNIKQVKKENPNSLICSMVKADAYGVGIEKVLPTLDEYTDFFGVACFFEANLIRNLTTKKILIVGALEDCVDERFSYTCSDVSDIEKLVKVNKKINIHLKVNSGMNRFGFKNLKEYKKALDLIKSSKLTLEGLFTHFATNDKYIEQQMNEFNKFVKLTQKMGFKPILHTDNSFANLNYNHNLDMVRIGFNLYNQSNGWFVPVVEIKSRIVSVQEVKKGELVGYGYKFVAKKSMRVGVVCLGYADGFDSRYVGIELNVNGFKCKVLNVCMDCFMIDISNANIKKGDELFIINQFNPLSLYANYLEGNEYEVMCKFSKIRAKKEIN